ncbi:MAG TPA: AI-2E family transporter [Nocardioides sp.]|nr:AI-2E family transporter [Nocardioides sp.]
MSNEGDNAGVDEVAADHPDHAPAGGRRRLPIPGLRGRSSEVDDGIAQRLAQQWAQLRDERRPEPSIAAGPSNFTRAQVPWGLDLAAAWGWRLLVIAAAGYLLIWLVGFFAVITLPLVVALLITALVSPVVTGLHRAGLPRGIASALVVVGGIAFVAALLTFAGQQVASGASDLADQVAKGLGQIKDWLNDGPLQVSDDQINAYLDEAQNSISQWSKEGNILGTVTEFGTVLTHVLAGFFIVLFSTYFFLADGERIWAWFVRLAPRAGREHVDGSGRVAWISLTQFVRATVIVALTDAIGIMVVAAILGVPFVLAIGVLVFLGAFIPMVGGAIAGTVAVLVALVDQGPLTALLMAGGVILVQQVEAHVLQPFLMGRWVSVHPLGVIFAIGAGVLVAGIAGALVAVPLAAAANAVVQHLAGFTSPGDDPVEELDEDYEQLGDAPPTEESLKHE